MIAVMQAAERGEKIEAHSYWDAKACWISISEIPVWNWDHWDYRVKPLPAPQPWTQPDVPPVCWIKFGYIPHRWFQVTAIYPCSVMLSNGSEYSYEALTSEFYSTELKVWKPCRKDKP
jgi:hypothetical protein